MQVHLHPQLAGQEVKGEREFRDWVLRQCKLKHENAQHKLPKHADDILLEDPDVCSGLVVLSLMPVHVANVGDFCVPQPPPQHAAVCHKRMSLHSLMCMPRVCACTPLHVHEMLSSLQDVSSALCSQKHRLCMLTCTPAGTQGTPLSEHSGLQQLWGTSQPDGRDGARDQALARCFDLKLYAKNKREELSFSDKARLQVNAYYITEATRSKGVKPLNLVRCAQAACAGLVRHGTLALWWHQAMPLLSVEFAHAVVCACCACKLSDGWTWLYHLLCQHGSGSTAVSGI